MVSQAIPGRPRVTVHPYYRGIALNRRTRADERGRNPVGCLSGRIRMVPGTEIAAVERREARHPLLGDANAVQTGFASFVCVA